MPCQETSAPSHDARWPGRAQPRRWRRGARPRGPARPRPPAARPTPVTATPGPTSCARDGVRCCAAAAAGRSCRPASPSPCPPGYAGFVQPRSGLALAPRRHLPQHARADRQRLPRRAAGAARQHRSRRGLPRSSAATASPSWWCSGSSRSCSRRSTSWTRPSGARAGSVTRAGEHRGSLGRDGRRARRLALSRRRRRARPGPCAGTIRRPSSLEPPRVGAGVEHGGGDGRHRRRGRPLGDRQPRGARVGQLDRDDERGRLDVEGHGEGAVAVGIGCEQGGRLARPRAGSARPRGT